MKTLKPYTFKISAIFFLTMITGFSVSCTEQTVIPISMTQQMTRSINAVDINTATAEELTKIPHIGPKLADQIVAFRTKHGPFRRTEHLMLIRGVSDNRYREIQAYLKTE